MVKISLEVAQENLDQILSDLDIDPDPDHREIVLRAISAGRLEWDPAEQEFLYQLIKPVSLDNGKEITEVTVTEPTAAQMKKSSEVRGDMDQMLKLISYCTDQPMGYIERLKSRDLNVLGGLVAFFR